MALCNQKGVQKSVDMGKRYVGAIPSFDWDEMLEGNELLRRIIFESALQ